MRVFDEVQLNDRRFAILVDDEEMTACEALWIDGYGWRTDSIVYGEDESFELFGSLKYDEARKAGYTFCD